MFCDYYQFRIIKIEFLNLNYLPSMLRTNLEVEISTNLIFPFEIPTYVKYFVTMSSISLSERFNTNEKLFCPNLPCKSVSTPFLTIFLTKINIVYRINVADRILANSILADKYFG